MSDFKVGDIVVEQTFGNIWQIKNYDGGEICSVSNKKQTAIFYIKKLRHATLSEKEEFERMTEQKEYAEDDYSPEAMQDAWETLNKAFDRLYKGERPIEPTDSIKEYFIAPSGDIGVVIASQDGTERKMIMNKQGEWHEINPAPKEVVAESATAEKEILRTENISISVVGGKDYEPRYTFTGSMIDGKPFIKAEKIEPATSEKVVRFSEQERRRFSSAIIYCKTTLEIRAELKDRGLTDTEQTTIDWLDELQKKLMGAE